MRLVGRTGPLELRGESSGASLVVRVVLGLLHHHQQASLRQRAVRALVVRLVSRRVEVLRRGEPQLLLVQLLVVLVLLGTFRFEALDLHAGRDVLDETALFGEQ